MGKPFKLKCPWGKATRSYPHYQLAKSVGASSIAPPIECRVYDNSRRSHVRGFTCYRLRKRTCVSSRTSPTRGKALKKKKYCTLCPTKKHTKMFFAISSLKPNRFV